MAHKGLKYVKQEQPSFIRKFREKAGMKPESTIEDKSKSMSDECNDEEKDDEKPVVVVLDEGDLTADEAEVHEVKEEEESGKIVFRKPTKRSKDSALGATSKKSKLEQPIEGKTTNSKIQDKKDERKSKNKEKSKTASSLLSFGDDDG